MFTLANLVDESENALLLADDTLFSILFEILQEAWADDDRRYIGFSVEELVDGMTGLAKNESNKSVLREKGAVPILMKIMTNGSDEEKEHSVKCIWELSFDKTNKQAFAVRISIPYPFMIRKLEYLHLANHTSPKAHFAK